MKKYACLAGLNNGLMVLILDGNLEIGAHVWRDLDYLNCVSHLSRSKAVIIPFFFLFKCFPSYVRSIF